MVIKELLKLQSFLNEEKDKTFISVFKPLKLCFFVAINNLYKHFDNLEKKFKKHIHFDKSEIYIFLETELLNKYSDPIVAFNYLRKRNIFSFERAIEYGNAKSFIEITYFYINEDINFLERFLNEKFFKEELK